MAEQTSTLKPKRKLRAKRRGPRLAEKEKLLKRLESSKLSPVETARKARETARKVIKHWALQLEPKDRRKLLQGGITEISNQAKQEVFLELYKEMWPNKSDALRALGASYSWLRRECTRSADFAADVLSVDLTRVERLKQYSYEQCFRPDNEKERMFWLRKINSDEFGDDPISLTIQQAIQTSQAQSEGFSSVQQLLKRREQLAEKAHVEPSSGS